MGDNEKYRINRAKNILHQMMFDYYILKKEVDERGEYAYNSKTLSQLSYLQAKIDGAIEIIGPVLKSDSLDSDDIMKLIKEEYIKAKNSANNWKGIEGEEQPKEFILYNFKNY